MENVRVCYLVVGPESSGTKLATQLLVAHGCRGEAGDVQAFDAALAANDNQGDAALLAEMAGDAERIVIRRSYPHGGQWPALRAIVKLVETAGFELFVVVVRRNWPCAALSQVAVGHTPSVTEALSNIRLAEETITQQLRAARVSRRGVALDYDFLVSHPRAAVTWLARQCGLEPRRGASDVVRLYNNDKHIVAILGGKV